MSIGSLSIGPMVIHGADLGCTISLIWFCLNDRRPNDHQIQAARRGYEQLSEGERADARIACREWEEKCPQQIEISEWMVHVHDVPGEGQLYEACIAPG